MNKEQCLNKLAEISKLEYDWDSYKALPVPNTHIQNAIKLLENLDYKYVDFIAPFSGGLQIEFKVHNKEANITFETTGYGLLLYPTKLFNSWIEFDNLTLEEVVSKFTEFYEN